MCTKVPSRSFGKYESFSWVQSFLPCLGAEQKRTGCEIYINAAAGGKADTCLLQLPEIRGTVGTNRKKQILLRTHEVLIS